MSQEIIGIIFQSSPYLLALLLGLLIPVIAVIAANTAGRWRDSSKIAVILGTLVLGNAISVGLTGRIIYTQEELAINPLVGAALETVLSSWAGRVTHAIVLFVSVGEIFRWVTGARSMAAPAKQVWFAFAAFYIASYWVGVIFATSRDIQLSWIYAPIAFTALAILAPSGCNREAMVKIQWVLLAVLTASLLAALVVPDMVVERGYKSWIPGFTYRLAGFSDHANSLGIIAALAVVMELSPFVKKRPNLIFLCIAVIALIFTQSKTAWMVAMVGIALVRYSDINSGIQSKVPGNAALAMIAGTLFVAVIAIIPIWLSINSGSLERFLSYEKVFTFTGRTTIWQMSWEEFLANPLFGYGPAIWDLQYRYQKNFMAAGQAHNQLFQTMGQAGLLGLFTLFWYLYLLGRNCGRLWQSTSGLALIIFISLLIRCFGESPMRLSGLFGMDAFVHLLAFTFAAAAAAVPLAKKQTALRAQRVMGWKNQV